MFTQERDGIRYSYSGDRLGVPLFGAVESTDFLVTECRDGKTAESAVRKFTGMTDEILQVNGVPGHPREFIVGV